MSVINTQLRRIFVLGGYTSNFIGKGSKFYIDKKHPLFGKETNPTCKQYIKKTITETLKMNGIDPTSLSPKEKIQIDNAYVSNFIGELTENQGHLNTAIAQAHPSLNYIPSVRVESACSSGGAAFCLACNSIRAGDDISLLVGVEVQMTASARIIGDYLARFDFFFQKQKNVKKI